MIPKGNKNKFEIHDNYIYMICSYKGESTKTKIDTNDMSKIKEFDYTFGIAKKANGLYVVTNIYENGKYSKRIYFHRWILGYDGKDFIDHINGEPLDNRKSNLRIVKPVQNSQNRKASVTNKSSGVRGVYWEQNKWRARIMIRGKRKDLGYFETVKEAKKAIDDELNKFWDTFI